MSTRSWRIAGSTTRPAIRTAICHLCRTLGYNLRFLEFFHTF